MSRFVPEPWVRTKDAIQTSTIHFHFRGPRDHTVGEIACSTLPVKDSQKVGMKFVSWASILLFMLIIPFDGVSTVKWNNEHEKKDACPRYKLHPDLLRILYRESKARDLSNCVISGATEMKMNCDSLDCIFRAPPWVMGKP